VAGTLLTSAYELLSQLDLGELGEGEDAELAGVAAEAQATGAQVRCAVGWTGRGELGCVLCAVPACERQGDKVGEHCKRCACRQVTGPCT